MAILDKVKGMLQGKKPINQVKQDLSTLGAQIDTVQQEMQDIIAQSMKLRKDSRAYKTNSSNYNTKQRQLTTLLASERQMIAVYETAGKIQELKNYKAQMQKTRALVNKLARGETMDQLVEDIQKEEIGIKAWTGNSEAADRLFGRLDEENGSLTQDNAFNQAMATAERDAFFSEPAAEEPEARESALDMAILQARADGDNT